MYSGEAALSCHPACCGDAQGARAFAGALMPERLLGRCCAKAMCIPAFTSSVALLCAAAVDASPGEDEAVEEALLFWTS